MLLMRITNHLRCCLRNELARGHSTAKFLVGVVLGCSGDKIFDLRVSYALDDTASVLALLKGSRTCRFPDLKPQLTANSALLSEFALPRKTWHLSNDGDACVNQLAATNDFIKICHSPESRRVLAKAMLAATAWKMNLSLIVPRTSKTALTHVPAALPSSPLPWHEFRVHTAAHRQSFAQKYLIDADEAFEELKPEVEAAIHK